jgi:hypothetical protein
MYMVVILMFSVSFKGFLVIFIDGNTDLIWRESTDVQFTDVLICRVQRETRVNGGKLDECADSRKKRAVGNLTTYVEVAILLLSFISFTFHSTVHSFISLSSIHIIHRWQKSGWTYRIPRVFERRSFWVHRRVYSWREEIIDCNCVRGKNCAIYCSLFFCFLYYYFWNLFAIPETWLKCKKAGKTPSHMNFRFVVPCILKTIKMR